MKLSTLSRFLNKELNVSRIADESRNGMQYDARRDVKKIGFAVDACIETFTKAKRAGCDLLIVHHGILWKKPKYRVNTKNRLAWLKKNKMSLYAAHLPLDLHENLGHNAQFAELLHFKDKKRFAHYHGFAIGFQGRIEAQPITQLTRKVNGITMTESRVLAFGPKTVKTVGVSSGGSAFALEEAIAEKLDCFITGELGHSAYHHAQEGKINVIIAGHYGTETLGLYALERAVHQKFNIPSVFIENPTGM